MTNHIDQLARLEMREQKQSNIPPIKGITKCCPIDCGELVDINCMSAGLLSVKGPLVQTLAGPALGVFQ